MAHLIDKDAALAEIESLKDSVPYFPTIAEKEAYRAGVDGACCKIYSIEVKEVDMGNLREELDKAVKIYKPNGDFGWGTLYNIAVHFFELGLNASNPLTWENIANINDIVGEIIKGCKDKILYDTQENFCKEVLKRFKERNMK